MLTPMVPSWALGGQFGGSSRDFRGQCAGKLGYLGCILGHLETILGQLTSPRPPREVQETHLDPLGYHFGPFGHAFWSPRGHFLVQFWLRTGWLNKLRFFNAKCWNFQGFLPHVHHQIQLSLKWPTLTKHHYLLCFVHVPRFGQTTYRAHQNAFSSKETHTLRPLQSIGKS